MCVGIVCLAGSAIAGAPCESSHRVLNQQTMMWECPAEVVAGGERKKPWAIALSTDIDCPSRTFRLDASNILACAPDNATYMFYTQTYGGTVQMLRHLTKEACDIAMNRALGRPATPEEKAQAVQRKYNAQQDELAWYDAHPKEKAARDEELARGGLVPKTTIGVAGTSYEIKAPTDISHAECFHLAE